MNITIINDCRDANATGRQITRISSLIEGNVSFIGVHNDLEAAGNLIDTLDASGDSPGVILVNVAPRNGKAKKWKNGTPFGYFWCGKVLVVSTVDGLTLSLVKKLKLAEAVNVLDTPTVVHRFVAEKIISREVGNHIIDTQFRSYDFLPRVAAYLLQHKDIVSEKLEIKEIVDAPPAVWWVDNFGNCKTTLLKKEIPEGNQVNTKIGKLDYYERLKDVPDGVVALITGSSGLDDVRFLEVVVQGKSAADFFKISSGGLLV